MTYPAASTHSRIGLDIEPEPELVLAAPGLFLPTAWPEERRSAFAVRWMRNGGIVGIIDNSAGRPYAVSTEGLIDTELEDVRRAWIMADPRIQIVITQPMTYIPFGPGVKE
jgi:hypothetical protein